MAATENYLKLRGPSLWLFKICTAECSCAYQGPYFSNILLTKYVIRFSISLIVFLEVNNAPSVQVDFVENIKTGTKNNIKCNSV